MNYIKIIDPEHDLTGKTISGDLVYYDVYHTGSSPDLFVGNYDGKRYEFLSSQIDLSHYENQLRQSEIERIGAKPGDLVFILKTGSGIYSNLFDLSLPHKITSIDQNGRVTFDEGPDNGGAIMFRPEVIAD